MNPYFSELGRNVLQRWKEENFSLPAFPGIAREALENHPPSEAVDLNELIQDFLLSDEQPNQSASGFGQPELIVYEHPRFYIQVLFWLDGTTDIHQHEFSGAFHVMEGSSLHSHFEFQNPQPITAHFRLGDVVLKDSQFLQTGCTVPITSGPTCIHSLFHLDTPSVTVVVRTQSDPGTGPQFTYLPPHVALDPVQDDALTMRRKQLLDALERVGDPGYRDLVVAMIEELDFERGFFILQNGIGYLRSLGAWEAAWEAFANRHGALSNQILPTLEEIIRRDGIANLRNSIEWVEHRFFMALLLNVPDRTKILEFVALRIAGDPIESILRWADELMDVSDSAIWVIDAEFAAPVDMPTENYRSVILAALRHFISGGEMSEELKAVSAPEREALNAAITASSLRVLAAG
ncbi:MAG: hypothetical protein ACOVMP_04735 [Chthoniobacterales bacterium]